MRFLVTSPRIGIQGMRAKCGKTRADKCWANLFLNLYPSCCVASVSVWFRSKERPRNGILGFGRARNETRAKKMKVGEGEGKEGTFLSSPPHPSSFIGAILDSRSSFFAPKPQGNAGYAGYFGAKKDRGKRFSILAAREMKREPKNERGLCCAVFDSRNCTETFATRATQRLTLKCKLYLESPDKSEL